MEVMGTYSITSRSNLADRSWILALPLSTRPLSVVAMGGLQTLTVEDVLNDPILIAVEVNIAIRLAHEHGLIAVPGNPGGHGGKEVRGPVIEDIRMGLEIG